jgi:hypothetical protein
VSANGWRTSNVRPFVLVKLIKLITIQPIINPLCNVISTDIHISSYYIIYIYTYIYIHVDILYIYWLVVWNICYFPFHIWDNPSQWRTHIFQRSWNHQPVYIYTHIYNYAYSPYSPSMPYTPTMFLCREKPIVEVAIPRYQNLETVPRVAKAINVARRRCRGGGWWGVSKTIPLGWRNRKNHLEMVGFPHLC